MKIGIADTTFSRINMGKIAIDELRKISSIPYERYTVPGIKDLPIAAKKLLEEKGCDIVITLGWVGGTQKDMLSYIVLSMGLVIVQLMTNKHVIDVTIHEDEAEDEKTLMMVAENRVREHVRNAVDLLVNPKRLQKLAGTGQRQGYPDVGPILK
ncbi:riboflavin synthase [Archaeoglobus fulgidus]|uniref:Riboflavin synthase n=3 Tax=Archaeoglobus fulgidus TaxID=2234 RepID=RISC_ARCFU|nr:riboflavin synthase [Archaeoglobus fulgidus]O28856.1 RecName: Full=Riboflavin synthase [Archaeoglobus fulgidus DSM 4304]AAB89831.1 riboflavin synthase (ribC) [Archaeoglobus fulgidus DSM 4304]AIG98296.1 riboflavin synthase [Archaeoglobus fulgidus DSM 8774]KUJ94464.1 MAG: Riboflavin synthase [Archaeoglobus fulgidus]KUK06083.1 MAG: Riboflavin synthase [Archaeoglobus fulgidus]